MTNKSKNSGNIRAALADLAVCVCLFAVPVTLYYIALGADALGVK